MNSGSNVGGGAHSPISAAHTAAKDPFQGLSKERNSGEKGSSTGIFGDLFLHKKVQVFEEQLQHLNSSKADMSSTSVGLSDTKFRFLSIGASTIIITSLLSLVFAMIAFVLIAMFTKEILLAGMAFVFIIGHSFFPGYIIYGMKKFVNRKTFTFKFYNKMINVWRWFEILYVINIGLLFYIQTLNWNNINNLVIDKISSITILKKVLLPRMSNVNLSDMPYILDSLIVCTLIGLILYMVAMFIVSKSAIKEQVENTYDHDRERLRPAQLARKRAGKV